MKKRKKVTATAEKNEGTKGRLRSHRQLFPQWRLLTRGPQFGKDAPFPFASFGLYWERIPYETIYQGNKGPRAATFAVIKSPSELASELPDIGEYAVNFDKEEVIVVGLGARPGNGYMVQIAQIMYLTDRGPQCTGPLTLVDYSEYQSASQLNAETYPVHVVKLRKLAGSESKFMRT
jgi:hypothetical protein